MLNKYLLLVSALVAAMVYFVFYEETETGTIEQYSPLVSVEIPNEFSELAQIGKVNYQNNCSDCHGENAVGQQGIAPPLVHKIYEPSHHGDESFQIAVAMGVRSHHWKFGNMPAIENLTRSDVTAIVAYVRELQRANGIF